MNIKLAFRDEDWERIRRDWSAWWAHELDRPMVMVESMNLLFGMPDEFTVDFMLNKPIEEVLDYYQGRMELIKYHGDSFPKWWPNFGPGIAAGFLGSKIVGMPNERTVWFEPPGGNVDIKNIHFEYKADNIWWRRILDLTRAAVERWGDRVCVGFTDIGGNLDIIVSFRGAQNLYCDLIEAPEEVARLSGEITPIWLRYYDELYKIIEKTGRGTTPWAAVWSPKKTYMLQCDFSYGISPKMFEKFALPDLEACCARLDHAFYHLDGIGAIPHLDMLLSIKNLRGIQWIPGANQAQAEEWLPLLKRIRDSGKLVQVFTTQAGARKIARELGGRGFALYVFAFPPMSEPEIESFINEMKTQYSGVR